ncbi:recombinase family protein [Paenibacillus sp. FSL R7-0048]|uniref:recombinase family protein n=1 Tax=Paenibacillus sp. FSL R7-0048 TaxID=2954528 RepID=UPI0030F7BE1A
MKAVAYTSNFMYNTVNQPSTIEQLSAIEQYALANSIEILQVYTDLFRDRIHDQKPGLLAMMDDADTQKFDTVLVYDSTCVLRDSFEMLYMEIELLNNDVDLISISSSVPVRSN